MEYGYIYKTTNLINNMFYIGQHKFDKKKNYIGSGKYLNRAINKYGRNNFKLEIIAYTDDKEETNILEIYNIKEHRNKFGKEMMYNLTDGGEGCEGYKHSSESLNKMRGKKRSEEAKKRMSKSHKGKHLSEAVKENLRLLWKGENNPSKIPEVRKKISTTLTGRKLSPEHIENVRLAMTGKKQSIETCDKKRKFLIENNPMKRPEVWAKAVATKKRNGNNKHTQETKDKIRSTLLATKRSNHERGY